MIYTLIIILLFGGSFKAGDFPSEQACKEAIQKATPVFVDGFGKTIPNSLQCVRSDDIVSCTAIGNGPSGFTFCGRQSDQPK